MIFNVRFWPSGLTSIKWTVELSPSGTTLTAFDTPLYERYEAPANACKYVEMSDYSTGQGQASSNAS